MNTARNILNILTKKKDTMNEQTNTAHRITDMLTHHNPEDNIIISNTHHTITIHTDGTWTQINH